MRSAGFSDDTIGSWANEQRPAMKEAGFDDATIESYFSGLKAPGKIPRPFLSRFGLAGVDDSDKTPTLPQAIGRLGGAIAEGAKAGFGEAPIGPTPEDTARMRANGIYDNGTGNAAIRGLRIANETVIPAAATGVEGLFRGVNAALMGTGSAIGQVVADINQENETGQAKARRDWAQMVTIGALLSGTVSPVTKAPRAGQVDTTVGTLPQSQDFTAATKIAAEANRTHTEMSIKGTGYSGVMKEPSLFDTPDTVAPVAPVAPSAQIIPIEQARGKLKPHGDVLANNADTAITPDQTPDVPAEPFDHTPAHTRDKIVRLYEEHGVHPSEVAADVAGNPEIAKSLASKDPTDLPAAYVPKVERISDDMLSEPHRVIEAKLADKIEADYPAARAEYDALTDSQGGKILNTDTARELSPDYVGDRSALAQAVHEPASAFVKRLYAERLQEMPADSTVLFTSGGTGAGKSKAIKDSPTISKIADHAALIYDTNMNSFGSSQTKIDQALAAGAKVEIAHVLRDPIEALTKGSLPRARRMGRTVPLKAHAETHRGSAETIVKLADHYKDNPNVVFHVVDNTRGLGEAKETDLAFLHGYDYYNLEPRLRAALEEEYKFGRINEATYRGTLGGGNREAQGARISPRASEADGRGNQPDGSGGKEGGASGGQPGTRQEGAGLQIKPHKVATADGKSIDVIPKVVEAADIKASSDAGYDPGLQPRDRDRAASQAQIKGISASLDPERLGHSAEADRGAPIVGPDGMVESGNGRVMAIRDAYQSNGLAAQRYREWLTKQGVDVSQYKEPILIRERTTPLTGDERKAFTVSANQSATLTMSAPERAMADARLLGTDALDAIRNPDDLGAIANRDFVRNFVSKLPQVEQGAMVNAEGGLSSEGQLRVRNAVLARAYGNAHVLTRITEATTDEVKSISNALVSAAPRWARLRADIEAGRVRPEFDITPELLDAVARTADLRSKGGKLDSLLAQQDAFTPIPERVEALMKMFYDAKGRRAASAENITKSLTFYAQEAAKVMADGGLDLGMVPVVPRDILKLAAEKGTQNGGGQSWLFEPSSTSDRANPKANGGGEPGRGTGGVGDGSGKPGAGGNIFEQAADRAAGQDLLDGAGEGKPHGLGADAPDLFVYNPFEPTPRNLLPAGRLGDALRSAVDKVTDIWHDIQMKTSPMTQGSKAAMAVAKDFANAMRRIRYEWSRIDDAIVKQFGSEDRARMWSASDEESVALQLGESREHQGLSTLTPDERAVVEQLQTRSQAAFVQARDLGMVEGEGLPSYTPRMLINIATGDGRGPRALNAIGHNLKTTSSRLKQRHHMMDFETEAAAKERFGEDVELARDIRALPLATADLETAIAGRQAINNIREIGKQAGIDTVSEGSKPGADWFTIDHPAFKIWRPKLKEVRDAGEGPKWETVKDAEGNVIFEQTPLYVHKDFEGPIRAVLDQKSGDFYKAAMALKGKTMNVIMNSPMIHNAVEYGRAFATMPGKMLTFRVYRDGAKAIADPTTMREAIMHGMVPIGHRAFNQDISSIMEPPELKAGRSTTSSVAAFVPGLFSDKAALAVKEGIDTAGNFWHNKLLWDQVAKLQAGLYTNFRDDMMAKGIDPVTAKYLAAHQANRYAGALPKEAMSNGATKIANSLLFSRSFTMGNLGVMKDMFNGMPRDVMAQIERDVGVVDPKAVGYARSVARRRAISVVVSDIVLLYVFNSMLQSAINVISGRKDVADEAQGYPDRLKKEFQHVQDDPTAILHPFAMLNSLTPMSENEPGKQDRVFFGHTKDGTGIYMTNPLGKIGGEFQSWFDSPLEMLRKKEGTIFRPLMQVFANDKGFGRHIYNQFGESYTDMVKNVMAIGAHIAKAQTPEGQLGALNDLRTGQGDTKLNALQAFGPVAGATFSKGAPGGPQVGELYRAQAIHKFVVDSMLPDWRRQIQNGDAMGAVAEMVKAGIPKGLVQFYVRTSLNPETRMSAKAMKDFYLYSTPEQRARVEDSMKRQGQR